MLGTDPVFTAKSSALDHPTISIMKLGIFIKVQKYDVILYCKIIVGSQKANIQWTGSNSKFHFTDHHTVL